MGLGAVYLDPSFCPFLFPLFELDCLFFFPFSFFDYPPEPRNMALGWLWLLGLFLELQSVVGVMCYHNIRVVEEVCLQYWIVTKS
jgi:hypothetical protein